MLRTNTITINRVLIIKIIFASVLICAGMIVFAPKEAHAIAENTNNIPWFISNFDKQCNGFKHYQNAWISEGSNNSWTTINVAQGQDSASLRLNEITAHCDTNIDGSGNIIDREIGVTRVRVTSASSSYGNISSGLINQYVDMDYGFSHFFNQRYIKTDPWGADQPAYIPFTLSGLAGLPPGDHVITVTAEARFIHQYNRNWGTQYICVQSAPGQPSPQIANGLDDQACGLAGPQFQFVIRVVPSSGGLVITKYGPNNAPNANGHPSFPPGWADPSTVPGNNWVCINRRISPNPVNGVGCGGGNPMDIFGNPNALQAGIYEVGVTAPPGWTIRTIRAGYSPNPYSNLGNASNVLVIVGGGGIAYVDVYYDPPPPTCDTTGTQPVPTTPALPEVGQAFNAQFGFGGIAGPYTVTITNLGGMPASGISAGQNIGGTAPPHYATVNNINSSAPGRYVIRWNVTLNGQTVSNCGGTINIGVKPYVKIYGNDIAAGGVIRDPVTKACDPTQVSAMLGRRPTILAQDNQTNLNSHILTGASAQYAAFAIGEISQFSSGGMHSPRRANTPESPVTGMTIGNYNPDLTIGSLGGGAGAGLDPNKVINYGGKGGQWRCVPNYYEEFKPSGAPTAAFFNSVNANSALANVKPAVGNGVYLVGKNGPTGPGAIFVEGDLWIGQFGPEPANLTYGGFSGPSDIPSVTIVVKGNIYISSQTTRIDGTLIAQDDGTGSKGNIYTCSESTGIGLFRPVPADRIYSDCRNQLVINGAFMAQNIKLMRAANSLRDAQENENWTNSRAGEVFRASEALYLATPAPEFRTSNPKEGFDAVTSLPPIL